MRCPISARDGINERYLAKCESSTGWSSSARHARHVTRNGRNDNLQCLDNNEHKRRQYTPSLKNLVHELRISVETEQPNGRRWAQTTRATRTRGWPAHPSRSVT